LTVTELEVDHTDKDQASIIDLVSDTKLSSGEVTFAEAPGILDVCVDMEIVTISEVTGGGAAVGSTVTDNDDYTVNISGPY
jgi:hypothetical protein